MTRASEMFELTDCDVVAETEKAIKVTTDEHEDGVWLPLSQVDKITRATAERSSVVRMTAWIAKMKGLR